MRTVVQRVRGASVRVNDNELSRIERGFLVLVAFAQSDTEDVLQWMAQKIVSLRVFDDDSGRMNLDLASVRGSILIVSQFTLYGEVNKGRRPSFAASASPELAEVLYDRFVEIMQDAAPGEVVTGAYRAHMRVGLVNDGPVTLIIDKEAV